MKLKTLKELEKHLFVDSDDYVCDMMEEDTDGDLVKVYLEKSEDRMACLTRDLKQEAIKWIKEIRGEGRIKVNDEGIGKKFYYKNPEITEIVEDKVREITKITIKQETDILERWIIHFFNITDEDLK